MQRKSFIKSSGKKLIDGRGKRFQIRGVNLGNWLVPECYIAMSSIGTFETGIYTVERGLRAMQSNPNLTDSDISKLEQIYVENYITEKDFKEIAGLGLNTVRLPFTWRTLTSDGITLRDDAFDVLDWALEMCEKYSLYAILDHHGAIGSQNQDFHSGDDEHFDLYGNPENRRKTIELWKIIAKRYRDREVVLGYDLLNECRCAPGKFGGRRTSEFYNELYQAVRSVDPNHLIFIEYFTFPIHGRGIKHYPWSNVAASYHIYNLTPFSQKVCLYFVYAMHLISGNAGVPVYVGEFNAWNSVRDWKITLDFFDRHGWSWTSWAYKANEYPYHHDPNFKKDHEGRDWGLFVLNKKPVDISSADFDQIADVYRSSGTEFAKKTYIYDFMKERFGSASSDLGKNSVERTLIIPLWCRALAIKKFPALLPDHDAARILKKLGEKRPPHPLYHLQCAALTGAIRQYDFAKEVKEYLKKHPGATVVEMGAGLSCLRKQMKNSSNPWYNLDLPDVIVLRDQYIPASANEKNLACDLTDTNWFDRIPFDQDKGIIFLAAGVLHYFDYETVRSLVSKMAMRFPGGVLVFDMTTDKGSRNGNVYVRSTGNATKLKFAVNDAVSELAPWTDKISNIVQKDYYSGYNPPTDNYSTFTKFYLRLKKGQLAVIHVEFRT